MTTTFLVYKVHYDHRASLPAHLKYSRKVTHEEHEEFLRLYRNEGIGGDGFHECLNFATPGVGSSKIYLPPTCIPKEEKRGDELVIFSITYKYDKELPSSIIGVHGAMEFISEEGSLRHQDLSNANTEPLHYHAEGDSSFTTLFVNPVAYDFKEGRHTPTYQAWGNGLRYITEKHAKAILADALLAAKNETLVSNTPRSLVLAREIEVIQRIQKRYFGAADESREQLSIRALPLPDKDLGYFGEKAVFEQECDNVKKLGLKNDAVEWVSQAVPQAPYDIRSKRIINGNIEDIYIEVKTTANNISGNVYLSSGQLAHMRANDGNSLLSIVTVSSSREVVNIKVMTVHEVERKFTLEPVKYRLLRNED